MEEQKQKRRVLHLDNPPPITPELQKMIDYSKDKYIARLREGEFDPELAERYRKIFKEMGHPGVD